MKITIISDTHDLLRPEIEEQIKLAPVVIHAGDVSTRETLEKIKSTITGKLYCVRGNADLDLSDLPENLSLELDGIKFAVAHKKKDFPGETADFYVCGHTHKYKVKGNFINPGSCGPRKPSQEITYAIFDTDTKSVTKVVVPHEAPTEDAPSEADTLMYIKKIMRMQDRNIQIPECANKLGLSEEFVATVMRVRVTHPGVSAHGILDKIEVNKIFDLENIK